MQAETCVTIQDIRNFAFKVWISNMPHYFLGTKLVLFFKIEGRNFQHLIDLRFHESSQNFSSFRQLLPKLRSMEKNEWKNTHIYFFSTFGSKINEFEWKKTEKNKKIPKTYKLQAITLTSNSH